MEPPHRAGRAAGGFIASAADDESYDMWDWLKDNHGAVSATASILTLFVWTLYFQLLYNNYRRLRRPRILINRGAGQTTDAKCIVANMSAEAIYIEAVLLSFGSEDADAEPTVCSLSDLDTTTAQEDVDPRRAWLQGPLHSGELIDIGSYQSLMDKASGSAGGAREDEDGRAVAAKLTVTVVASYLSEDGLVAAERVFDLDDTARPTRLMPRRTSARQIRSTRSRRSIERLMMRRNIRPGDGRGQKSRDTR
jgi:hypothetical protein